MACNGTTLPFLHLLIFSLCYVYCMMKFGNDVKSRVYFTRYLRSEAKCVLLLLHFEVRPAFATLHNVICTHCPLHSACRAVCMLVSGLVYHSMETPSNVSACNVNRSLFCVSTL
jgi:hypothetical protein